MALGLLQPQRRTPGICAVQCHSSRCRNPTRWVVRPAEGFCTCAGSRSAIIKLKAHSPPRRGSGCYVVPLKASTSSAFYLLCSPTLIIVTLGRRDTVPRGKSHGCASPSPAMQRRATVVPCGPCVKSLTRSPNSATAIPDLFPTTRPRCAPVLPHVITTAEACTLPHKPCIYRMVFGHLSTDSGFKYSPGCLERPRSPSERMA